MTLRVATRDDGMWMRVCAVRDLLPPLATRKQGNYQAKHLMVTYTAEACIKNEMHCRFTGTPA
jgi:hypothetical protein